MKIYKVLATNLSKYIEELENSNDFKKDYPNMDAISWLSSVTDIPKKRIKGILSLNNKPKIHEAGRIADALMIPITKLFEDGTEPKDYDKHL